MCRCTNTIRAACNYSALRGFQSSNSVSNSANLTQTLIHFIGILCDQRKVVHMLHRGTGLDSTGTRRCQEKTVRHKASSAAAKLYLVKIFVFTCFRINTSKKKYKSNKKKQQVKQRFLLMREWCSEKLFIKQLKMLCHFPPTSWSSITLCWCVALNPNKTSRGLWFQCRKIWKT